MFERFTDRARRVLVIAQEEARGLGHGELGSEHILLGLLGEAQGVGAKALAGLGLDRDGVRRQVVQATAPGGEGAAVVSPPFTPGAKKSLEGSLREALNLGHNYIGTEHLLLGLLREPEAVVMRVLVGCSLEVEQVRGGVLQLLSGPPAESPEPSEPDRAED
ncbi:MAG: hypothetical protein KY454_01465 [Actinobacteria bacterium]|nr:hypothetical protein [Actinomycetota bacterium]MBW3651136.1 hypothetical protein [Actinomycetota bacterium]